MTLSDQEIKKIICDSLETEKGRDAISSIIRDYARQKKQWLEIARTVEHTVIFGDKQDDKD
jgi:predicted CopG family antitoxin